jgi:hypothetical protein
MKGNRSNELVEVVAYVTYDVEDENVQTSIGGLRELGKKPNPIDARTSITFGPAVSKDSAIKALQMVLDKIETEGLPCLVTKVEKRIATRLMKLQKDVAESSNQMAELSKEVRAQVKRIFTLDI